MPHEEEFWIQRAIKRPGALRRWAKRVRALTKRGTVDLKKAEKKARKIKDKETRLAMLRRIILAKTLRRFR
jgi:hypothetical protein